MTMHKEILGLLDREATIAFARELVKIPSENPPGNEKETADLILDEFQRLGLKTRVVEAQKGRPNILATLEGSRKHPILLFNGHTDVVPAGPDWEIDPYAAEIRAGKLYGRGACDMKGGLAAMMAVARVFRKAQLVPKGTLNFAIVVDEETGGKKGTGYLVENGYIEADMAIVAEPSDFRMSISEPGVMWIEIVTRGTQTHTINKHKKGTVNAVEKMGRVIVAFEALAAELKTHVHEHHGPPILSVNTVSGGMKVNIIPDECRLQVDLRFPAGLGFTVENMTAKIKALTAKLKKEDPDLDIAETITTVAHPFEQSEDMQLVKIVETSARQILGRNPEWWRRGKKTMIPTDDSDAYHLWVKGRIPSMYFGPGKLEQCHVANEHIDVADIHKASQIYTLIALNVLTESV